MRKTRGTACLWIGRGSGCRLLKYDYRDQSVQLHYRQGQNRFSSLAALVYGLCFLVATQIWGKLPPHPGQTGQRGQ